MDNSTVYKYYNLAKSKGHSDEDIAGRLKKKGFEGGLKKIRQIVKGTDRKVKSAGKQIQKAETQGKADGEISKFVKGVIRELFSGVTYEQYPKMVAGIESRMEGTDYNEVLGRIQGEMNQFTDENPATAIISNMAGGFVSGYAELKILSGLGLLPKALQLKSGQPIRNIARSGFISGPLTAYPASIASVKALRDRGVYEEPVLDQEEVKNATFPPIMSDPSVTIPTALSAGLGPVGDALGSLGSRVTRGVKSRLSPGGGEGNPRDPSGSIGDKSGPERSALSEISERLERDVGPSTDPIRQRIDRVEDLGMGNVMTLADKTMTGPQTRALAGRMSQTPSRTASEGQQFLEQRITGQGNPIDPPGTPKLFQGPGMGVRVGDLIQDLMGVRVSPKEYLNQLAKKRARKAPKLYDQAYVTRTTDNFGEQIEVPNTIQITPKIRQLFQRPVMESAFVQAQKLAKNDDFVLPDNLFELNSMTVKQADYLQRGIKDIEGPIKFGDRKANEARQVSSTREGFLDEVDGQLMYRFEGESPFKNARSYWAGEIEYNESFDLGLKLGRSDSVNADDLLYDFSRMSDSQKEAVKLGMVSGFLSKIEGKKVTQEGYSIPDTGRFINQRFEKILGGLFPDGTSVSDFMTKMRLETDTGATYNKIFQGSPTSVRETEQRFAPSGMLSQIGSGERSAVGAVRQEVMNMGLGDLARKKLTQEAEAGGKRLFDPNPVNQMKTLEEVDEIRRMNQMLMKRGLLTQGGLPGALTGIYPMSLLD